MNDLSSFSSTPKAPDGSTRIAVAAVLKSMGMSGAEIGEFLHLGAPRVAELVGIARDLGWLVQCADVPEPVRSQALDWIDEVNLVKRWGHHNGGVLRKIVVCNGADPRAACAARAAFDLIPMLGDRTVGVAWGLSVLEFARYASAQEKGRVTAHFVPVCGDPLCVAMPRASASASAICELLNRAAGHSAWRSMTGIPAFFPKGLDPEIIKTCKAAFGGPEKNIAALITGIGGTPLGFDGDLLLHSTGVERKAIEASVAGDLAGVLLPKEKLTPRERAPLGDLVSRWTGLEIEDLIKIARQDLGVVVIASAADKLSVLLNAINLNLVTRVYASRDLFALLKERMSEGG